VEEVLSSGKNALDLIAPEDRQRAIDNALKTQGRGAVKNVEYALLRKDGTSFPGELSASLIIDVDGTPRAFTAVTRDISERKRAEQALQKAREDLEAKAEQRMAAAGRYNLTFRELTVLYLIAAGMADKEIAFQLGISSRTASKHVENILQKMGVASRTQASVQAFREGLVDDAG
jgi:DNA-binding CsgD family transcriptional regulator